MRLTPPSLHVLFVVAVLCASGTVLAESTAPPQGAPAGTRVIVRAVTSAGEPITDLKKEEISVRTDGKQREIKDLTMVGVSSAAAGGPAAPASALPAPYVTTRAAATGDSREFLILLDDEGLAAGREEPVRAALNLLISRLNPADHVGLLSLRIGGVNLGASPNHDTVKTAISKMVGGGTPRETSSDLTCRTKRAIDTLGHAFRDAPAGRTIVLVSSGLAPVTAQSMASTQEQSGTVCQLRNTDLEQLTAAAGGSAANLYVLSYPDGMANPTLFSTGQQGLENVAGTTNGESIRITGTTDTAGTRIPRETSVYYIATLDEGGAGPVRRVDGRVTRDGIRAHIRPVGARAATAPAGGKGMTPRDMIKTTAAFTEVPLRAAGFISRQGTNEMKVVTLFEPIDPTVKLTAASVGLIGDKGSGVQWSAQPADLQRSPVAAGLPVVPGRYRVRVAVTTASGAGGTVDYELVAALEEVGPLKMSRMLLGTSEKGFVPRLQFSSQEEMVVSFLELYNVPKGANLAVKFEVAENEKATPVGEGQGTVAPGPGEDARIAYGGFGITTLQPGDYVMRATISLDGKVVGTAVRTLRKVK